MSGKLYTVLIADDAEADRCFLKRTIRRHAPKLHVVAEVGDGEQVVAYFSGKGPYADRETYPLPELLMLDLRMPRMTGLEVLEWLEKQPFPQLKIAVMAGFPYAIDQIRAVELGVEHFLPKVMNNDELIQLVIRLQNELEMGENRRTS